MEQDSEQDKPVFTVVYVSSLKVKECWEHQPALQTEGLILPEDIGAGLYDGCKNILVEAHSDAGYYFYGKPAN